MKFKFEKKNIRQYLSFFLCIISAFVLFILLRSLLPKAVTYSVSEVKPQHSQVANAISQNEDSTCLYNSLFDIQNDGPFRIISENDEIYILFENKRIYRINANLSDFPEGDRKAIEGGITAYDRRELFEIVSYIES